MIYLSVHAFYSVLLLKLCFFWCIITVNIDGRWLFVGKNNSDSDILPYRVKIF